MRAGSLIVAASGTHEGLDRPERVRPLTPGGAGRRAREVITSTVVDYLRSGVAAGMLVPDASHPSLETFRVTAE